MKMDVLIPKWMGEYKHEELERMICTIIYERERAFKYGWGFITWVCFCNDIWMASPK